MRGSRLSPILFVCNMRVFEFLDTTLRPITLELCCVVIRGIVLALEDDDTFVISITDLAIEMQKKLAQKLSEVIFSEDLFLEMFEEEYYLIEVCLVNVICRK